MNDDEVSPVAAGFAELCERAVAQALAFDDPQGFLDWMQEQPLGSPADDAELPAEDRRRLLYWLGRGVWERLPRPGNGFRPRALAAPRRNGACPCGSGIKFKHCCARLQRRVPPVPESLIRRAFAGALDAGGCRALGEQPRAPLALKLAVARRRLEGDEPELVEAVLGPAFAAAAVRAELEVALPAVDLLMDAFARLGHDARRHEVLEALAAAADGPLAGHAHAQLGGEALVRGGAGEEALRRARLALKADPGDPWPALLEISALAELGRLPEARERAAYWLAEAERHWADEAGFIEQVRLYRDHPERAHPEWPDGAGGASARPR